MTLRDVERWIKQGRGSGEGASYRPWIRVRDVPSHGRSRRIKGLKTGRIHHLLSDLEYAIFLLAEYSQEVVDIREQFPLLPYGTTELVAASMRVRHPRYPQSDTPVVMSHDFVLTMRPEAEESSPLAISAKYQNSTARSWTKRLVEKLEIERRHALETSKMRWTCVTDEDFDPVVISNLDWLHYGVHSSKAAECRAAGRVMREWLHHFDYQVRPLGQVLADIGREPMFRNLEPLLAFKLAAWQGCLALDLASPMSLRLPVRETPPQTQELLHAA